MAGNFAHISDPHLTSLARVSARDLLNKRALGYLSWKRKRRVEHSQEVLAALQEELAGQALTQLVITGDLTHIGLPDEFRQARDWLEQLGSPADVALVPGNHDACVAAPWDTTFALWQDYMAADHSGGADGSPDQWPTLRVRGSIAFIGVSTGVPTPPLMATGSAGPEQIKKLGALLRSTAEQGLFRVVYMHHCPIKRREKWRKRLTDAPRMQRTLQENGAELVLHGHGHRRHFVRLSSNDGVIPVIAVPSASGLGLHGADRARYNHYGVSRTPAGWRLDIDTMLYSTSQRRFVQDESSFIELVRPHREAPGEARGNTPAAQAG